MHPQISTHILTIAGALFYANGIRAVGIDSIVEEANVAKATLYRHFPSKEHLVAAYLQERDRRVLASLQDVILAHDDPRQQLAAIFEKLFEKADSPEFRGCAFALAVAEHGESARITTIVRQHKAKLRDVFDGIVARAGLRSRGASAHLALLYEGALAIIAVDRDPNAVLTARDCALSVLDSGA